MSDPNPKHVQELTALIGSMTHHLHMLPELGTITHEEIAIALENLSKEFRLLSKISSTSIDSEWRCFQDAKRA